MPKDKQHQALVAELEKLLSDADRLDGHHELAQELIDWCIELDRTG